MRALVAILILASAATVRAEGRPQYGGTVVGSLLGEPASLDPIAARSHAEISVVGLVFDTLYEVGVDGAITPDLAAGPPQLSPDGLTATIAIRKGVVFHDGSALTAKDVAASLDRLGKSDAGWLVASIASVSDGADAITLTLRVPTPDLATLLAQPQTAITPNGAAPKKLAIGSGPYRVAALDRRNKRLTLRAFDGCFAGRPYIDELELHWYTGADDEARRYENGDTQLSLRGASPFAGHQPKYATDVKESSPSVLAYVGFGRAHAAAMASADFRAALSLALGRSGFTTVGTGERVELAIDPVPVALGGVAPSGGALTGDLDQAKAALARAARAVPALAPTALGSLSLEIVVDASRPDDREDAERVVRALDKLGIASAVIAEPGQAHRERIVKGTADLYIGQLAAPVTTAWLWWASAFAAGADNWAMQQLATGSLDPALAQKQFAAHLPIIPLMFRAVKLWHRTDVRGLVFDASGRPCFADVHLFGEPQTSRGKPPGRVP